MYNNMISKQERITRLVTYGQLLAVWRSVDADGARQAETLSHDAVHADLKKIRNSNHFSRFSTTENN